MMPQLLAHLWGDYILQSDWMAENKTKDYFAAWVHACCYMLPFLLLRPSVTAWWVMLVTHFVIDRFRLARYVVWAKNWMGPKQFWSGSETDSNGLIIAKAWGWYGRTPPFSRCAATGYPPQTPVWLSVWLLIIADNTLHLTINYCALRWL